jgi:hypothetical protein
MYSAQCTLHIQFPNLSGSVRVSFDTRRVGLELYMFTGG